MTRKRTDPGRRGRGPLASADFRRLWAIGAVVNAMRWVEMLAAALFTLDATGSGMAVAFVSAARSLPLLTLGALAGVLSDAIDRKAILLWGLVLSSLSAATIAVLGAFGLATIWHVAIAAFVSGSVWATEMSTRRRMVGESAGPALISRAVAMDSIMSACSRIAGPIIGGLSYAWLGLWGAFTITALVYAAAALLVPAVTHSQETKPLRLARVPRELAEGFAYARTQPTVLAVLAVTLVMNTFAFAYSALVAPIAIDVFLVSAGLAGVLGAAEPAGSLLGALYLTNATPRTSPRLLMLGGSAVFLTALVAMPLMPGYWFACLVLTTGGIGLAFFGNMQTSLILTGAPPHVRSRQLGLITVCIGSGPLGQIAIGILAEELGPVGAVVAMSATGLAVLALVAALWARAAEPPAVFG